MITIILTGLASLSLGLFIGTVAGRFQREQEHELQTMPFLGVGAWSDDEPILALSPGPIVNDEDAVEQRLLNQIDLDRLAGIVNDAGPIEVLEHVRDHVANRPDQGFLTINDDMAEHAISRSIEHLRDAEQLASRPVRVVNC
ncbi:MAG: hypothetical protein AAF916_04230 [Planctomycetota bacterium]